MGTLKPHSNGALYSNTVIGRLAVDGWVVTFGTSRMGLGAPSWILMPKCKNAIFSKTKQFRAVVCIIDLQEVAYGLFKEPITGPLKSNMAEIRHLES